MPIPWFSVATHFKGLSEVHGAVSNPTIIEMFRVSGHPEVNDDETPWCAAFVGACLRLSGYKSSGLLGARSYATFGQEVSAPQRGAIVVFWRTSPQSGSGHVAFFDHEDGDHIYVLGGNQCDAVSVARFPKTRVIGYRQPVEIAPLPDSTLPNILTIDPANAPIHLSKPQVAATETAPLSPKASDALSEGAVGASVQSLQAALASRGFQIDIDGEFGPQTRIAVAGYQSQQGLPSTGVADDATLRHLGLSTASVSVVPTSQQPPLPDLSRTERLVEALLTTVLSRQQQAGNGASPSDEITRFLKMLAEAKTPGAAAATPADTAQLLQTLLRVAAAAAAADGKSPAPDALSTGNTAQALQTLSTLLSAATSAAAKTTSAASGTTAASNVLLSPIDSVLGGQALAGKKTALAVVAYALLAIFQSVGVVGNATGADATTTGQVLTTLIGAFGALGGLAKVDRIVRALAVIAVK
jgi:uncharacterized protein (TIGR02594 family)